MLLPVLSGATISHWPTHINAQCSLFSFPYIRTLIFLCDLSQRWRQQVALNVSTILTKCTAPHPSRQKLPWEPQITHPILCETASCSECQYHSNKMHSATSQQTEAVIVTAITHPILCETASCSECQYHSNKKHSATSQQTEAAMGTSNHTSYNPILCETAWQVCKSYTVLKKDNKIWGGVWKALRVAKLLIFCVLHQNRACTMLLTQVWLDTSARGAIFHCVCVVTAVQNNTAHDLRQRRATECYVKLEESDTH
jgi:hypothetical protein